MVNNNRFNVPQPNPQDIARQQQMANAQIQSLLLGKQSFACECGCEVFFPVNVIKIFTEKIKLIGANPQATFIAGPQGNINKENTIFYCLECLKKYKIADILIAIDQKSPDENKEPGPPNPK